MSPRISPPCPSPPPGPSRACRLRRKRGRTGQKGSNQNHGEKIKPFICKCAFFIVLSLGKCRCFLLLGGPSSWDAPAVPPGPSRTGWTPQSLVPSSGRLSRKSSPKRRKQNFIICECVFSMFFSHHYEHEAGHCLGHPWVPVESGRERVDEAVAAEHGGGHQPNVAGEGAEQEPSSKNKCKNMLPDKSIYHYQTSFSSESLFASAKQCISCGWTPRL